MQWIPMSSSGPCEEFDHVVYVAGGLDPASAAHRPIEDALGALSPLLCTLETARKVPDISVTYVSSGGAIYGNPAATIAVETDPPLPVSAYGVSRLAGEVYSQMYARTFGFPTRVVRCANVYGPGQSSSGSQGAVAVFLHRVDHGLPVAIVGDGSAIRDYVHVDDVAAAISKLVLHRVDCGIVNVGSGSGHSVLELLEIVSAAVGRAPVVEFVPRRPYDVNAIVLDISKLRALISYEATSIGDGVRMTWDVLKANAEAVDAANSR